VSLPSQRDVTRSHCKTNGWIVVEEYVEAATATDDRRPAFQQMMERACDPDRPFSKIVFYSFNRFFRNGADMELAILPKRWVVERTFAFSSSRVISRCSCRIRRPRESPTRRQCKISNIDPLT
jgi:hypothetical protein